MAWGIARGIETQASYYPIQAQGNYTAVDQTAEKLHQV